MKRGRNTDIKRILLQKSTTDRILLDSVAQGKRSFADSVAQGKRSFADSVKSGNSREPVLLKVDLPHPTRKHSAETITAIPAPTCDGESSGELPRPDVRMPSDWKTVKRKREVIKGQKTVTSMFKSAARSADLYVGRCDKSVSKDTIKNFCVEEIKVPLLACQCISRDDSDVKSFKLTVSYEFLGKLLDPALWPEGVHVRKLYYPRNNGYSNKLFFFFQINTLRLCSYNCNSIRSKVDIIRDLLDSTDILVCQEIILLREYLYFLESISNEFNVSSNPSKAAESDNFDGRPSGGFAIFWRKSLGLSISIESTHVNFVVYTVSSSSVSFCQVNIYMHCNRRSAESAAQYGQALGELQASISQRSRIVLMGDFNADPNKGAFWPLLNEFIESNSFVINDFSLPIDTFTYLSPAHNSTSWLDHIISTSDLNISNISIKYDISLYDHFPLCADISIPVNTGSYPPLVL